MPIVGLRSGINTVGACRGDEELRSQLGQNPLLLQGLLHLMRQGSDAARYWCCQCIVSLSHKHTKNQSAMAKFPGMMEAILEVLLQGSALSRGAACSALVESTFRNAENALLVAKTPGMMHGVVSVMQSSVGDVRDDAAGVLRNCSNYSREAAEVIVQTAGVLDALVEMCKGSHNSDRFTAMGTIQNLTRCESVTPLLYKTRVVAEALVPSLQSKGTGEEHDVMRAEALMAITNLATADDLKSLVVQSDIVEVIVQMLRCAVRGQAWKDVAWYDAEECLHPLAHMTVNPGNHGRLRTAGLVHVLTDLLCYWIEDRADALSAALHTEARSSMVRMDLKCSHGENEWKDVAGASGEESDLGEEMVINIDTCIGIGHERLRHALSVLEVAACCRTENIRHQCDDASIPPDRISWCNGERRESPHEIPPEVDMSVLSLVRLAKCKSCARTMRRLGLPAVLRAVAVASAGMDPAPTRQAWAHVWVMEPRHLAVSMGQHPRLGSKSFLMQLDAPILWLIMQSASDLGGAARRLAVEIDEQHSHDASARLGGTLSPLAIPALVRSEMDALKEDEAGDGTEVCSASTALLKTAPPLP